MRALVLRGRNLLEVGGTRHYREVEHQDVLEGGRGHKSQSGQMLQSLESEEKFGSRVWD